MSTRSDQDHRLALQARLPKEAVATDLCDKCQILGDILNHVYNSAREDHQTINVVLGTPEYLQAKSWCRSCVIICKYIAKSSIPPLVSLSASLHHQLDGILIHDLGFISTHPIRLRVPLSSPKLDLGTYEGYPRSCNPSEVDVELIRKWIKCCDVSHGNDCLSASLPPPHHLIWLVDVVEGCLISAPSDSRYVALR